MSKTPHIKVDAFPLVDDHFSGVGHYTLGIVKGLDQLAGEGKLEYSLVTPRRLADRLDKYHLEHCKKIIKNPIPNRVIRGILKFRLPIPLDIFVGFGNYYFPSFLAWPLWFSRSCVVVHDVTYLAVPECVDKGNREYLSRVVPHSLATANKVITVSEFSKKEVIKYYHLPSDQISVAHPSVDRSHFYKRSEQEVRKAKLRYDIFEENYILCVGNIEPRKNHQKLIQAYTQLPKKLADKYPLVLVGAGGWNNDETLHAIQEAKESGYKIIHPKQFVKDEDMPALFSGALFSIFVPIYEGFGMPPLESYACGTPVLASNVTSVPEAAGKAAVYTNPHDAYDIKNKLEYMFRILAKDPKHFNKKIEEHLASLNWRNSAEITASAVTGVELRYFRSGQ